MGAGKSTLGPLLARELAWSFVDLDQLIADKERATIAELFQSVGEAKFRELESAALAGALELPDTVLALGGGATETPGNRELIARDPETLLVYLEAPVDILIARCERQPGAAVRPVLQRPAEVLARFLRRKPFYESADWTVNTADLAPSVIVESIVGRWRQLLAGRLSPRL